MDIEVRGVAAASSHADPTLDVDFFHLFRPEDATLSEPDERDARLQSCRDGCTSIVVQLVSAKDAARSAFAIDPLTAFDGRRGMLSLEFSDGFTTVSAIVVSGPIPELDLSTPPGTKLALDLRGGGVRLARCVGGGTMVAVLNTGNTRVLGGRVAKLAKKWAAERRNAALGRLGDREEGVGAPCFEPFTPEFLRATAVRMEREMEAAFARQTARREQRTTPKGSGVAATTASTAVDGTVARKGGSGGGQPQWNLRVVGDVQVAEERDGRDESASDARDPPTLPPGMSVAPAAAAATTVPQSAPAIAVKVGTSEAAAAIAAAADDEAAAAAAAATASPSTALSSASATFVPGPRRLRAATFAALRESALAGSDTSPTAATVWEVRVNVVASRLTELHTANISPALRLTLRDAKRRTVEVCCADALLRFLASVPANATLSQFKQSPGGRKLLEQRANFFGQHMRGLGAKATLGWRVETPLEARRRRGKPPLAGTRELEARLVLHSIEPVAAAAEGVAGGGGSSRGRGRGGRGRGRGAGRGRGGTIQPRGRGRGRRQGRRR